MTGQQARCLLEGIRGDRLEVLWATALLLGLRRGEVLALRWDAVDWTDETIKIRQSLTLLRGTPIMSDPKTASSRRTIPLPELVLKQLSNHRRRQEDEQAMAGSEWHDTGLIFTTLDGRALSPRHVLRLFHQMLERVGLPPMRFHDLRRSCATLLAAHGVPPRVTQEILGHADIRTTLALYTDVFDESRRSAASTLDRVLGVDMATPMATPSHEEEGI